MINLPKLKPEPDQATTSQALSWGGVRAETPNCRVAPSRRGFQHGDALLEATTAITQVLGRRRIPLTSTPSE